MSERLWPPNNRRLDLGDDAFAAPPADLRNRVTGQSPTELEFRESGRQSVSDFEAVLATVGKSIADFENILDFGCGSGRILRHFSGIAGAATVHGCDTDPDVVAWCESNLPFARFEHTNALPPLPYADNTFDLIVNFSVFTHLPESFQDAWLAELARVTTDDAVILLTVNGLHGFSELVQTWLDWPRDPTPMLETMRDRGFLYIEKDSWVGSTYPDWYHSTFHSPAYVMQHWGRFFEIAGYFPRAGLDYQDIVLLRNGQVTEPAANFLSPTAATHDGTPPEATEEFVRFLYEVVLDRTDVDAPAVGHWVTKLRKGEFTKAELFAHFLITPEGRSKFNRNPYFTPLLNVWDPAPSFSQFGSGVGAIDRAQIVDVGAMIFESQLDVYEPLVTSGKWDVVGFEPNRDEARIRQEQHPEQCVIPDALGDGNAATLHINQGVATSSLLESNTERLDDMIGLANWMVTVREENLSTRRLDDVAEVRAPALLKLDVQGGELLVLESAVRTLEETLVVHVETEFFPMYKNQPLFRDIDTFLSENGFEFFSFGDQFRYYCNDRVASDTRKWPTTRLIWTDSIFVPTPERIDTLDLSRTMSLCWVMHDLYNSYDYAAWVLGRFDDRHGSSWRSTYLEFTEQEF